MSESNTAEKNQPTMDQRTLALLHGPIFSMLGRMAAPTIFLAFIQGGSSFADTWFVGRIGTTSLAGIALVFPLIMLVQMLSAGAIGGAVSSSISRALGAGNARRAELLAIHAVVIALVFGLIFAVGMIWGGPGLYSILGGRGEALSQAVAYSRIIFAGSVLIWLCNIFASILRGTGNMFVPAVALSVTGLVQIPLSGSLVLGWGPFPEMGIVGAGISYICAFGAAFFFFAFWLLAGRSGLRIHWRGLKLSTSLFRDILGVGLLSSINTVQTVAAAVILTGLVGSFGTAALAGYGLGVRLEMMQVPIIFALGSAIIPIIGISIGAGDIRRAKKVAWMGAGCAACLTGAVGITVAMRPEIWAGLFSSDPAVLAAAFSYLRIVAPFYTLLGIGIALYFASQGAGRMFFPMLAGTARFLIAACGGFVIVSFCNGTAGSLYVFISLGMLALGMGAAAAVKWTDWH
jgi:putative MATE family efflux protein